jgi:uncharacterized protein
MVDRLEQSTPFHAGERELQRNTGETDLADRNGRWIGTEIVGNAVEFVAQQELAIVATVDGGGQPWCSAIAGRPGGFQVLDPTTVGVDLRGGIVGDGLVDRTAGDPRVGLLFIELATRRRYRVNGEVIDASDDSMVVRVVEAYRNCPKYIQRRRLRVADGAAPHHERRRGANLGEGEQRFITSADTFFVASANRGGQLDASHRGGRPGFVRVDEERLRIPDYAGNGMFNTLGNLAVNPAAGLLFVDFATGATLQLAGTTTIDLDARTEPTGGTNRAWTFDTSSWVRSGFANELAGDLLDASRYNP